MRLTFCAACGSSSGAMSAKRRKGMVNIVKARGELCRSQ